MILGFDADLDAIPVGVTTIEASAGTGKTYAITHAVARMVAEDDVPIDRFLIVTYTRAAATELRTRTREALVERRDPDRAARPPTAAEAARLDAAIAGFDAATITTIHGFCQLALGSLGVQVGRVGRESFDEADDSLTREVVRDHLLRRLADDPGALDRTAVGLGRDDDPSLIEAAILEVVGRHLGNQGSRLAVPPAPGKPADHPAEARAAQWGEVAGEIVAAIAARRQRAAVATFDSLISDLAACLDGTGPVAQRAGMALRSRFSAVLVDEFQDTDRLQWQIFARGFIDESIDEPRTLLIVGDPKQAIYRFRGADIGTYVEAVRGPDGRREPRSLATNHRSDVLLLKGLNAIFNGATFDHAGNIAYVPVTPRKGAPASSVTIDGEEPAPIEIRWTDPDPVAVRTANETILDDLVSTIAIHLSGSIRTTGSDGLRPITPGDLAVLVKSNHDGDLIARYLSEHGIPAVRAGVGVVETSPAALQWRVLLHAMARPSDTRRVRLAATGWFFGLGATDLNDAAVTAVQATIAAWSNVLASHGLQALWQRIRHTPAALVAIAALGDGDRGHTDLEHLAEVLHRGLDGRAAPAERVLALLDDLRTEAREVEERRRRIESDAEAVQITTIHSSKGLEYPIVLIPFGVKSPNNQNAQPYVFGHNGQRWVDAGPRIAWNDKSGTDPARGDAAERKRLATLEVFEEDRRLMYVALTRAKHRLVIWVRHGDRSEHGGAGRLLWGARGPDGALLPIAGELGSTSESPAAPVRPTSMDEARKVYDSLARLAPGAISHHHVAGSHRSVAGTGRAVADALGGALEFPDDRTLVRPGWRAWSYSGLTSEDTAISNYGPAPLRDDEPDAPTGDDTTTAPPATDPWSALSAGTGFGDAIHRILEDADFEAMLPGRTAAITPLRAVVERHGFRLAPTDDRALLTERILDAVRTPLGVSFADRCPAEVLQGGSLRELEFSFDLGSDDGPAALGRIASIAPLLGAEDPFRGYFARIGPGMLATDEARGFLSGSIDLVARDPGEGDRDRYWVVDYKTNREPSGRYDQEALHDLMEHGNYPLQAALYLVALQRFLTGRLGDAYDPATHLGGASYWFVRGMLGASTPGAGGLRDGVCTWRPSPEFIRALDELLGGLR